MAPVGSHQRRPLACSCTACRADFQVIATRAAVIAPIAVVLLLVPGVVITSAPTEHMSAPVAFAASLAVDAIAVAYLYLFLQQRLTAAAYIHHESEKETVPLDWTAADWSAIGDRLQAAGVDPGELNAIKTFSGGLNLSTAHQARNLPGLLGRMSLWEVPRRRRLTIIGIALGLAAAVVSDVFPSPKTSASTTAPRVMSWTPLGVLIVVGGVLIVVGLLLVAGYSGTVMMWRNITRPRFAIAVPSEWRRHLAGQAAPAAALLCHEFSHLRHRDVLQRRIIFTLGGWTSFSAVFSAGLAMGIGITGKQDLSVAVGILLMITAAIGGVLAARRARRLFPLAQEVRADAEVLGRGFTAEELRAGLTALHEVAQDSTLAMRLRIITAEASGPFLPGFRTMVTLVGVVYVLPIVTLTGMALA